MLFCIWGAKLLLFSELHKFFTTFITFTLFYMSKTEVHTLKILLFTQPIPNMMTSYAFIHASGIHAVHADNMLGTVVTYFPEISKLTLYSVL